MENGISFQDEPTVAEAIHDHLLSPSSQRSEGNGEETGAGDGSSTNMEFVEASSNPTPKGKLGRTRKYPPKDPNAPKKKHGRPRIHPPKPPKDPNAPKRKLGRPRIHPPKPPKDPNAPKEKRGRPRIHPPKDPNAPKKKQGRPRINPPKDVNTPKRKRVRASKEDTENGIEDLGQGDAQIRSPKRIKIPTEKMSALNSSLGRMQKLRSPRKEVVYVDDVLDESDTEFGDEEDNISDAVISDSDSGSADHMAASAKSPSTKPKGEKRGKSRKSDTGVSQSKSPAKKRAERPKKSTQKEASLVISAVTSIADHKLPSCHQSPKVLLKREAASMTVRRSGRPQTVTVKYQTGLIATRKLKKKYGFVGRNSAKAASPKSKFSIASSSYLPSKSNKQSTSTRSGRPATNRKPRRPTKQGPDVNPSRSELPATETDVNLAMLDLIHTQQSMIQDHDVMFCMSLVDKFRQLDQDQRTIAQMEILDVLHGAKRHATIPGLGLRSTIRRMDAEGGQEVRYHNGGDDDDDEGSLINVGARDTAALNNKP